MNSCKGVIRSYELTQLSDEEVLDGLAKQNVIAVKPIFIKKDGNTKRTNTLILTFSQIIVPSSIKAGFLKIPVQPFIPSPLRCFKCQQYGHHKFVCKHDAKCARCGQAEHGETACDGPLYCVNCKGNHAAYDKACPRWKNEVEIVKVKTTTNVSFPEARKIVEARIASSQPITGISFSAMARPAAKRSISTQTDIVRCTCRGSAEVKDLIEVDQAEITASNMKGQTGSTQ